MMAYIKQEPSENFTSETTWDAIWDGALGGRTVWDPSGGLIVQEQSVTTSVGQKQSSSTFINVSQSSGSYVGENKSSSNYVQGKQSA